MICVDCQAPLEPDDGTMVMIGVPVPLAYNTYSRD